MFMSFEATAAIDCILPARTKQRLHIIYSFLPMALLVAVILPDVFHMAHYKSLCEVRDHASLPCEVQEYTTLPQTHPGPLSPRDLHSLFNYGPGGYNLHPSPRGQCAPELTVTKWTVV